MQLPEEIHNSILHQLALFDEIFEETCFMFPQNNSFDLIGTENSVWKFLVNEKGVVTIETQFTPPGMNPDVYAGVRRTLLTLFDPEKQGFGKFVSIISQTCLDGWLPVSVTKFRTDRFELLTEQVFADENGDLLVRLETDSGISFFRIMTPRKQNPAEIWKMSDPKAAELSERVFFDAELAKLQAYWNRKLAPVLKLEISNSYLKKGVLASLVKSFITQYNGKLRYGATRYYCDTDKSAESFPPTILTMTDSCLFYGLPGEAKRFLGYFLDNFISSEGEILHRGNGASLSEHGMLLETFAGCIFSTKDDDFLKKHFATIEAVASYLTRLIKEAGNGLVKGCPEDDLRDWPSMQWFSSNLWITRGLIEFSRLLAFTGLKDKSIELLNFENSFEKRVVDSCRKSAVDCGNSIFVPPCLEWQRPFSSMNEFIEMVPGDEIHSLASYTNYRFFPEMLSSRLLPDDLAKNIIFYRKTHNGDFHGVTTFRIFKDYPPYAECFDDWPIYNYLRGLSYYGEENEFLRILCGHMAHHQARGTFFAPEMSFPNRLDSTHCIPSQLVIPLAIKEVFSTMNRKHFAGRLYKSQKQN